MLTIFLRGIILFTLLLVVIRLMGKRQIGEMEPFELVITLVISEIACIPMGDKNIPLTYGIVSILTLYVIHQFIILLSKNTKIHNLAQTMIFTPHISSMVAVGILWVLMLDPQGIINQFLAIFGIQGPNWLMNARTSLLSVALVTVWKSIGYYCLIIIAGLQSLPRDVYEAARLDKASRWTILRRITLPLMTPTLSFVFIMKFINAFKSFSAIDVMTKGGPQGSSMVLGYWIYNAGRVKFNYGFAMVGAIVLTALVAVFTLLANKGFRKED